MISGRTKSKQKNGTWVERQWRCIAKKFRFFMYSQNRNCAASVPIPLSCGCERSLLHIPTFGSVHLFSCSRIGRPTRGIYKTLTEHECRNWDWSRAVPFLAIFVQNFRYCVFACKVKEITSKEKQVRSENYKFSISYSYSNKGNIGHGLCRRTEVNPDPELGMSQKLLWILRSYNGSWGVTLDPGELLWILGLGM